MNQSIYVNANGKRDQNASKKFDDTLIVMMDSRAILLSSLSDINKIIGQIREYMVDTMKIAIVKHGIIHPKSKSIKINQEYILTPISPMLWDDLNKLGRK